MSSLTQRQRCSLPSITELQNFRGGLLIARPPAYLHVTAQPIWPRIDSLPPDEFRSGMVELSQDLIVKEQQIEVLISSLPGLDNSEMDQERYIKELEEDLKIAEAQRQEAIKEKDQILSELDSVIRSIRRP
ncbi:mediator-RNA polymerase II transcription subunit 21 [Fusarium mundagurra]|uniref:Mediator of RNA polymerase II transcription subunit 21 n=1 Tax=Fusarium mundagurra TaxID=1567541 RepID=A0A8H6DHN5_9HYPO|nr:mediator-RNA polymerase II transcription subunit 21 [Fusarium mundagurra]